MLMRVEQDAPGGDAADPNASRMPNCFMIGAAKCGTTSLAALLGRHRNIFVSRPKEPRFFGPNFGRGLDWYMSLFDNGAECAVRMDATTYYSSTSEHYKQTPELIKRHCPDARIIYVTRHPLERIESHWRHRMGKYAKTPPFEKLMDSRKESRLIVGGSLYFARIAPYRTLFGDDRIHVVTLEDLISDPRTSVKKILRFLEVRRNDKVLDKLLPDGRIPHRNEAGANGRKFVPKPEWTPELRARVLEVVAPDARAFLEYIGKPADFWPGL
jgi:hypothetical protein